MTIASLNQQGSSVRAMARTLSLMPIIQVDRLTKECWQIKSNNRKSPDKVGT